MFLRGAEIIPGTVLGCDVCVVGAGAAGIAVARELSSLGAREVVVLESGRFAPDESATEHGAGELEETPIELSEDYLQRVQARIFGGTSYLWSGICKPFDPIDLERKSWIEHSGWPISYHELAPYYGLASQLVKIKDFVYEFPNSPFVDNERNSDSIIQRARFHLSPPTRFLKRYKDELMSRVNAKVILGCVAVELFTDENARTLKRIKVKSLEGADFFIEPRNSILAAGVIENARILLNSRSSQNAGLGNLYGTVGRYFSEQLELEAVASVPKTSRLVVSSPKKLEALGHNIADGISFKAESIRRLRIPNLSFRTSFLNENLIELSANLDPRPNPESRVKLASSRDRYGYQKPKLIWKESKEDYRNLLHALEALRGVLAQRDKSGSSGGLSVRELDSVSKRPKLSPSGTTRMHSNPRWGVVDRNCKVHGMDNLFVAGSSVFTTPTANPPMLTVLALSLRLADYLESSG